MTQIHLFRLQRVRNDRLVERRVVEVSIPGDIVMDRIRRQIVQTYIFIFICCSWVLMMDVMILPSDFQDLLRYCLQTANMSPTMSPTTSPSTSNDSDGKFDPHAEKLRKLIDGIRFSRSFILTYQLVLLGFLFLFTAKHWWGRYKARGRRYIKGRICEVHPEQGKSNINIKSHGLDSASSEASNSSSTIHESYVSEAPNSAAYTDEESPLLDGQSASKRPLLRTFGSKLNAWLVYQPYRVPVVNKALPSNGTSLVVLALFGLQAFYLFYRVELSFELVFVFADRASLLFVANLPLLYLLAAKNAPIKSLSGYSYESVNIFHRRFGEIMCLLALLHSLGMIGVWYGVLRPTGITLVNFLLMKIILLGIGALISYEMIYFTSLGSFRQRWYELFLGLHVVLQILALVFVFFHHSGSRPYVGVALGIFLIDRLIYRLTVKSRSTRASLEVMEDEKTTSVCATLARSELKLWTRVLGSDLSSGWQTTEHLFLTIPALARKHIIQAHPFTIASAAPQSNDNKMNVRMIIRAQDGFSNDLLQFAKCHTSAIVRLDGPYGSQSAVTLLQNCENAVLVAGGSGIAVIWPLLSELMSDAKSSADAESCNVARPAKSILFIWVVREASHISWIGETKMEKARQRGIAVIIPPPTAAAGHPDVSSMISSWITDKQDSEKTDRGKTGVVCSGPDGMNRAVRNACSRLIGQGQDVAVNIEKFGW